MKLRNGERRVAVMSDRWISKVVNAGGADILQYYFGGAFLLVHLRGFTTNGLLKVHICLFCFVLLFFIL